MYPLVDNVENVQMSPASMKPTIGFDDVPRVQTEPSGRPRPVARPGHQLNCSELASIGKQNT